MLVDYDIVVFSGGSSVGERDLIRDAIAAKGKLLFHGVAVKPGKPTGLGVVDGKPVFAMPGYPTSCLSNAHMLLVPMLRRIARLPPRVSRTLTLPLAQRDRLGQRPASVLYSANREWHGGACIQGIRRHHQHVARGRIHRDSRQRGRR